ncbi:MAG: hypothetical protein JXR76_23285 [Deltaproteobacteria bacterium]|nr:hypothetical protein [Deltaproteobacteria bacterium]
MGKRVFLFFVVFCILVAAALLITVSFSKENGVASRNEIISSVEHGKQQSKTESISHKKEKSNQFKRLVHNLSKSSSDSTDSAQELAQRYGIDDSDIMEFAVKALRDSAIAPHIPSKRENVIEEIFVEQTVDESETQRVHEELLTRLKKVSNNTSRLKFAQCHESICKIITEHIDADTSLEFYKMKSTSSALDGAGVFYSRKLDSGRIETLFYMEQPDSKIRFYDAVYDRLYERVTGNSVDDIEPTPEQLASVADQLLDRLLAVESEAENHSQQPQ